MEAVLLSLLGRLVLESAVVSIGSASDNQMVVNGAKVSSYHAELRLIEQGYSITDLASTNGTFVNAQQLISNVPHLLNADDIIRVGNTSFRYEVGGVAQQASMPESSHVNKSTQNADTHNSAVESAESEPLKEKSSEQAVSPEVTQTLSSVKPVSLKLDKATQEIREQTTSSDTIRASVSPKAVPASKLGEIVQEANARTMSGEAALVQAATEAASRKSDEAAQETEKQVAPPAEELVRLQQEPRKVVVPHAASEKSASTDAVEPILVAQSSAAEHAAVQHEKTEQAVSHLETPVIHDRPERVEHSLESEERKDKNDEEDDEDNENFLPFIQERRFTFKGMSRPQRFISGLAIGQVLASALLILLKLLPHPLLLVQISTTTTDGTPIGISAAVLVAALIFYILAWSFLLSGALHGPILMRILVLGVFSVLLIATSGVDFIGVVLLIVLLPTLWIWGLVVWLIEHRAERECKKQMQQSSQGQHEQPSAQPQQNALIRLDWGLYLPTFLPVLGLLVVYHALLLGHFLWYGVTAGVAPLMILRDLFYFFVQIYAGLSTYLLIPVLFLTGSDFAELGEAITRSGDTLIGKFRTRTPWLLALVIALVALFIIERSVPAWTGNVGSWLAALLPPLVVGACIIAILAGIVYLTGLRRWFAFDVKPSALHIKTRLLVLAMLLTIVLGIYVSSFIDVLVLQSHTQSEIDKVANHANSLLLVLPPLLTALLFVVLFTLRRRKRPTFFAIGAIFFLVLGMVNLGYRFSDIVAVLAPGVHFDFSLSSILLTVSVATLIFLCWLLFKRQITAGNTRLLSLLLVLNGGLGFVALMSWIYGLALENSKGVALLQAILLLVALGWDIFTSGENTNKSGPHSPRHTRLLLFLGYIMLVATAVLYFSSQVTYPGGKQLQELHFESENWPQLGLLFLGVPLVITTFILQVSHWWGLQHALAGGEKALSESAVSDGVN